jgi:PAS domain S-box-containing protein
MTRSRFAFRPFADLPIKRKIMAIIMGTTATALLVAGVSLIISEAVLLEGDLEQDLRALSRIVADNSTAALAFDDARAAGETLSALRAREYMSAACIYRADGSVLATYARAGLSRECPPAGDERFVYRGGQVTVARPIALQGRRIGMLVLLYDVGRISERLQIYGVTVLAVLLGTTLVALVLSSRFSLLIAGPLIQLAKTATSVSESRDFSIRATKLSNDELGVLVEEFNGMLARVQATNNELIQALREREEALHQAQTARDSLRTTLTSIGDAVVATDAEGRVVFVNPVAQALLGLAEQQCTGRHLDEVFHIVNEFTRAAVESPVAKVLREGAIVGLANHTVLIAADGTEIPIDDSGAPIRGKEGAIEGTVLVFRDVSDRRRAQETSRLLAAIVETSEDAIITQDLAGLVTSWNRGAERIFGYTAGEIIGRSIAMLAVPGRNYEMPEVVERIRQGDRIAQYQTMRRRKDGELIHVSVSVSPLHDAHGELAGVSKIARDVTDQVRAAERLALLNADLQRSNERLARSNEDLERFAFVASHDLQEPLRMITVYSQLLVKEHASALNAEGATFVGNMVAGARRMRELLTDLLAYAEIGASSTEPAHQVDLNKVLNTVLENLKAAIEDSGATIEAGSLPPVRGYEGHFIPLFQNLVSNAIKYRGEQPPRIRIWIRSQNGQPQFAVADNGIGIDPQYHEKIFMAFTRLHGKKIPGTGIGLAICQRVVQRYGGRIWVESQPGQGATFLFTLPAGHA